MREVGMMGRFGKKVIVFCFLLVALCDGEVENRKSLPIRLPDDAEEFVAIEKIIVMTCDGKRIPFTVTPPQRDSDDPPLPVLEIGEVSAGEDLYEFLSTLRVAGEEMVSVVTVNINGREVRKFTLKRKMLVRVVKRPEKAKPEKADGVDP